MKRHKFTVGALVVATGLFYLFLTGFQQSSSMHATLQSLTEEVGNGNLAGQRIQLGGSTVVPGSIAWDKYKSSAEFDITDGERTLHARYCPILLKTKPWSSFRANTTHNGALLTPKSFLPNAPLSTRDKTMKAICRPCKTKAAISRTFFHPTSRIIP